MTSRITIAGLVALAFVTGSIMTMSGAYAATQGQPFQALDRRITVLEEDNVQSDSFFDVFTELGLTPANFFNVFDILQRAIGDPDFDLLRNGRADFAIGDPDFDLLRNGAPDLGNEAAARAQGDIDTLDSANQYTDSFFDVFTEISVHNADISRIDTELVALDLRGQSCRVGDVVTGIDASGNLLCATDQTGSGGGSSGQLIVVQRFGPTTEFSVDYPFRSSFATCLSGEMVVGGGYRTSDVTVNISSELIESAGGILGWFVNAYSPSGTGSITAIAECATITP